MYFGVVFGFGAGFESVSLASGAGDLAASTPFADVLSILDVLMAALILSGECRRSVDGCCVYNGTLVHRQRRSTESHGAHLRRDREKTRGRKTISLLQLCINCHSERQLRR